MEREVGGGIGMGNTCKPLAVSFQCMTKSTTNKKKKKKKQMGWVYLTGGSKHFACLAYHKLNVFWGKGTVWRLSHGTKHNN